MDLISKYLWCNTYIQSNRIMWMFKKLTCTFLRIERLTFVPPSTREMYYMWLLLNVQVGCKSFEDIWIVEGHVFYTYRKALSLFLLNVLENEQK